MKTRLTVTLLLLAVTLLLLAVTGATAQQPTPGPTPAASYVSQLRFGANGGASPELVAAATAARVPQITGQLFQVISAFSRALWTHPETAQATVDSLGEKAAPLFVAYGEFAGPLAVIDPVSYAALPKPPAGYVWSIVPPPAGSPRGPWPVGQRSVLITYTAPAAQPNPDTLTALGVHAMEALTNAVRERRAQPIRFEVDGEEIEISPPTIAQTLACVRLDPAAGRPETEAQKVVRFARQAKILLGPEHAALFERLQPLQVAEIVGALYIAASGFAPDDYVLWQQQQRKAGEMLTAIALRQRIEALILVLSARQSKMPAEIETMPLADAASLHDEIQRHERQRAELDAIIAGVELTWKDC